MVPRVGIIAEGNYMARIYKRHGSSVKCKVALDAIKGEKTVAEICQEYSVASSQVFAWKKQLEDGSKSFFEDAKKNNPQEEIDRLHKVIGQLAAERDFFKEFAMVTQGTRVSQDIYVPIDANRGAQLG